MTPAEALYAIVHHVAENDIEEIEYHASTILDDTEYQVSFVVRKKVKHYIYSDGGGK